MSHKPASPVLNRVIIGLVRFYQLSISLMIGAVFGQRCRFHPSCSHYAMQCYQKYSFLNATNATVRRLSKCGPWNPGGVDLP
ncbi:MAG: membrane protein insertion efficiency factor YidD [Proteobacteria bacterium]|nr:membrane protein insertion efficiency factor YidD [Pseudomonadota bacterium]